MFHFTYGTVYKHFKETPFVCSTLKTLEVALKSACFKITEHASMFVPTHEPVAT